MNRRRSDLSALEIERVDDWYDHRTGGVAQCIAENDRRRRQSVELDREHRCRAAADVGAGASDSSCPNDRDQNGARRHDNRSARIVARFTYAWDAASAGLRTTTG